MVSSSLQEVVFSGVRFAVESTASLIFSTNASTEFTGIDNLVSSFCGLGVVPAVRVSCVIPLGCVLQCALGAR